ncbi:hypothetical protein V5O48_014854 [Marasmius crinis-equi]|uniref:DUF6534 domain-containing protein n=1 Tax=Marasmius crinis-equi TaxID=585013 RepID=A0ABR3EW46_9AGAR
MHADLYSLFQCIVNYSLSGTITVQTLMFFKLFPGESYRLQLVVLAVWALDTIHTGLIWGALWKYFVTKFGVGAFVDHIPIPLALSVLFTVRALFLSLGSRPPTVIGYCRLFKPSAFIASWHAVSSVSKRNWRIAIPVVILASLRLVAASASTVEMLVLKSYGDFEHHIGWLFTAGLGLSSGVDVLITVSLCYLLRRSRSKSLGGLYDVIDTMITYTFETGSITAAATIVSMICWILVRKTALVFMGLHFMIGKLYASSLLVTLNVRTDLRRTMVERNHVFSTVELDRRLPRAIHADSDDGVHKSEFTSSPNGLQINVERTVEWAADH